MGDEEKSRFGGYISDAGTEIGLGLILAAGLFGLIRGCTDDHTVTHEFVNPPAVERLQEDYQNLQRQYDVLERRVMELEQGQ